MSQSPPCPEDKSGPAACGEASPSREDSHPRPSRAPHNKRSPWGAHRGLHWEDADELQSSKCPPILFLVWLVPRRWQLNGAAQKAFNSEGGTRLYRLCCSRWQSTLPILPLEEGVVSEADCMKSTGDPGPSCKRVLVEAQNQSASKTAQKRPSAVPGCLVQKLKSRERQGSRESKASFKVPKFRQRPTYDWNCSLTGLVRQVLL